MERREGTTAPGGTLPALTSLRAIAALQVVVYHFGDSALVGAPRRLQAIVHNAQPAVTMLFVLSGFVLTYGYADRIADGRVSTRAFWRARFARVYPLYVAAWAMEAIVLLLDPATNRTRFAVAGITQLAIVHTWLPPLDPFVNRPSWSVCVEVAFYALFPFLVRRTFVDATRRKLLAWGAAIWLLGLVIPVVYALRAPADTSIGPTHDPWLDFVRFSPVVRLPELVAGMILGRLFLRDVRGGVRRDGTRWALAGFALYAAALAFRRELLPSSGTPVFHDGLLVPVAAMIVFGLAHGGRASRWLSAAWLVRLGAASYAIYVFQQPLLVFLDRFVLPRWDLEPFFLLQIVCVLVPFALLAHDLLELPARRWILGVLGDPTSTPSGITKSDRSSAPRSSSASEGTRRAAARSDRSRA